MGVFWREWKGMTAGAQALLEVRYRFLVGSGMVDWMDVLHTVKSKERGPKW